MFLYSRGRKEEARKIFKELGKKTNCEIDDNLLKKVEADIFKNDDEKIQEYTILDLFRHKKLALASANLGFAFLVNSLVFFGLTFNLVSFSGSVYVNNTINGLVGLAGYALVMLTIDKLGRRLINGGCLICGGLACLLCMAIEKWRASRTIQRRSSRRRG